MQPAVPAAAAGDVDAGHAVPADPAVPAVPAVPAEEVQPVDDEQAEPVQGLQEFLDDTASVAPSQGRQSVITVDPVAEAARQANLQAQREIVENVVTLLRTPAVSTQLLMLAQDEIQRFSVAVHQAPPFFRQRYATQSNFAWALAGFNWVVGSFYRGGERSPETIAEICAGCLDADGCLHSL